MFDVRCSAFGVRRSVKLTSVLFYFLSSTFHFFYVPDVVTDDSAKFLMLPIPGTSSLAHLEENMTAAKLHLTADDWKRIEDLARTG
jgi:hypothetical protein